MRDCVVDFFDHNIPHQEPYDWDSIMHYTMPVNMMYPHDDSFVSRDVSPNNRLSMGDVATISMIHPKPKGNILMPRSLVPLTRQRCTFEIAHNSVPRVVLGLSAFRGTPSQSKNLCALAVRHPSAIKFDLEMVSEDLSGNMTPVYVAIDPHIAEIYVQENEYDPQTAECYKERYPGVNDPFLGFLKNKGYVGHPHDLGEYVVTHSEDAPTVIISIDHFRFDGGSNQGRITIDQEKLLSEKGLHKAITVSRGFHGVSMSWFNFPSAALNI